MPTNPINAYNYDRFRREVRRINWVTISLVAILINYITCWLPWNVLGLYLDLASEIELDTDKLFLIMAVCHMCAMASATTNAILYGFMHTAIKKELAKYLHLILGWHR